MLVADFSSGEVKQTDGYVGNNPRVVVPLLNQSLAQFAMTLTMRVCSCKRTRGTVRPGARRRQWQDRLRLRGDGASRFCCCVLHSILNINQTSVIFAPVSPKQQPNAVDGGQAGAHRRRRAHARHASRRPRSPRGRRRQPVERSRFGMQCAEEFGVAV